MTDTELERGTELQRGTELETGTIKNPLETRALQRSKLEIKVVAHSKAGTIWRIDFVGDSCTCIFSKHKLKYLGLFISSLLQTIK